MTMRMAVSLVCAALLCACERVVSVDVAEGPPRLVVQARLERVLDAESGVQQIVLTTTSNYFSATVAPPARGATVRVTDDAGRVAMFTEQGAPGVYRTTQLVIHAGQRYTLGIDFEGDRYEATETAMPVAPIDSIYFALPLPGSGGPKTGLRATIDLRDPRNVRNYYLWDQFVDGVRVVAPDTAFRNRATANDDGLDGRPVIGFQPYDGVVIKPGSHVLMRQVGLSEAGYRYYFALSDQLTSDGSPFAVPAASVRGNITNRTHPARFPLGYFLAASVAEAQATLPADQ